MEHQISRRNKLLADIEEDWTKFNSFLDTLTDRQMTTIRDPQGWSVKDHMVHITAWERSILFFLQGQPQYVGLDVDESLFSNQSDDDINAVIYKRNKDVSLAKAGKNFQDAHQQLMNLLTLLNDTDLLKPTSQYVPDGSDDKEDSPVLDLVYGNTCEHFREHLSWIKTLIG